MAHYILEDSKPLSQSIVWQFQRRFYQHQGIRAWNSGTVPYYITSNPYIAGAYAQVILGFLRDCLNGQSTDGAFPVLDTSQPLYIVELGAGSGRFSFHFLKLFQRFYQKSSLASIPVKYIMTDISEDMVTYWRQHDGLRPFVEADMLDFALFSAGQDTAITLAESAQVLDASTIKNPMVVVANYVFDSIPQDCFYFERHRIYESLVKTLSSQPEEDYDDPELMKRVFIRYETKSTHASYYPDRDYNQLLRTYQNQLDETTFLFPKAPLDCIRHFREMTGDRLLFLSGDKGYIREESLYGWEDQELTVHGSFSMMVNYHAIAQYVQNVGGSVLQMSQKHDSLSVAGFLFGQHPHDYVETRAAYDTFIEMYGPDDFFVLKEGIEGTYKTFNPTQLLSFLKLSHWDAYLYLELAPALIEMVDDADDLLKEALLRMAHDIWDMYYPIGEAEDVAFQLGMLLYKIDFYTAAITFFKRSLEELGPHASTYYNLSLCHVGLDNMSEAEQWIDLTLELDPAFAGGQDLWREIQDALAAEAEETEIAE
ncbi:MAG: SAM-dependent methyltransferase [Chloroflexota bacterium]